MFRLHRTHRLLQPSYHLTIRHKTTKPIAICKIDHVCLCTRDVKKSISWYENVLGLEHFYKDEEHFYPTCKQSPAFMRSGEVRVALYEVEKIISDHKGAHLAFTLSKSNWEFARLTLPKLLEENKVYETQIVSVDEEDYGIQKGLFFQDPDNNILEISMWK